MIKTKKKTKATKLTPPDKRRCQAEKPNGATFMTLGGVPGLVRCNERPKWIAVEMRPGSDGRKGSMSVCEDCRHVMERQMPGYAEFERIK